jgi:hypothetical protein
VSRHAGGFTFMSELKKILKKIVDDLEKSAVGIRVLASGASDQRTAKELAVQENKSFYSSLRQEIDALPDIQR